MSNRGWKTKDWSVVTADLAFGSNYRSSSSVSIGPEGLLVGPCWVGQWLSGNKSQISESVSPIWSFIPSCLAALSVLVWPLLQSLFGCSFYHCSVACSVSVWPLDQSLIPPGAWLDKWTIEYQRSSSSNCPCLHESSLPLFFFLSIFFFLFFPLSLTVRHLMSQKREKKVL